MALEPITRQEKIIAGQDLTPITRMEKFLKQYGGGSGGVTSWNDLTDKPFGDNADGTVYPMSGKYVEGMGYVEKNTTMLLEKQELAFATDAGNGVYKSDITLTCDMEYVYANSIPAVVVFDGVEHKLPFQSGSAFGFGNATLAMKAVGVPEEQWAAMGVVDTGEDFMVVYNGAKKYLEIYCSDNENHTVEVYLLEETIHPIDQKFLPSAFVVNFATTDMQNWTADKTADEIAAAVNAGKEVYGSVMGTKVDLIGVAPNGYVTFGRIFPDAANLMSYHFSVTTDNSVQATMASLQMTPMG